MLNRHDLITNALDFAAESLDDGQYESFVNFVTYIDKLILKDYKKLRGSDQVVFFLNRCSCMDYSHSNKFGNNHPYSICDGIIDPIITDRKNLEGIWQQSVRDAASKYFERFGWKLRMIKESMPKDRCIELYAILERPSYGAFAPAYIDKPKSFEAKTIPTKKVVINAFDFEKDNYEHLEI